MINQMIKGPTTDGYIQFLHVGKIRLTQLSWLMNLRDKNFFR